MQFTHALIRLKDFLGACCAGIIFRHGPRPVAALAGAGGGFPFAPEASSKAALRQTFFSVGQAAGQASVGASGVQAGPPLAANGPSTPATEFGYQLQHFSQRAHVLASLAINKKLPARQAFLDMEKLWQQIAELGQALEEIPEAVKSALEGLTGVEAEERLEKHGLNEVAHEKRVGVFARLVTAFKNPLVLLLLALATVSYLSDDMRATVVISAMAFLSVALRVIQEAKADNAAEQLQAMVHTTATVLRDGVRQEVPLKHLVPGDVVFL
ncbi:MAG: cation-transporting P-type ATPase, partial [Holophaga sp.]|nr:cation-transporting P-type ATPase [Holophaga sp.]